MKDEFSKLASIHHAYFGGKREIGTSLSQTSGWIFIHTFDIHIDFPNLQALQTLLIKFKRHCQQLPCVAFV